MTLLVELDQNWLADVGFGDGFLEPLAVDAAGEQVQPNGTYRLDWEGGSATLMRRVIGGSWESQYRFTLQPHSMADYATMCLHHQTSPLSTFPRKKLVTRATPQGRITLSGMRLITTLWDGTRTERALADSYEYDRVLVESFGIDLNNARRC